MVAELSATDTAERLRAEPVPLLLDVREDWEWATARIAGAVHIPMGQVPARMRELPTDRQVIVLCHHGQRSMAVARWLASQGYDVANMTGGIDAWSCAVDDGVPRYL